MEWKQCRLGVNLPLNVYLLITALNQDLLIMATALNSYEDKIAAGRHCIQPEPTKVHVRFQTKFFQGYLVKVNVF